MLDYQARWKRMLERDERARAWAALREQFGLTEAQVVKYLGISERSLRRYEREKAPAWYRFAIIGLGLDAERVEDERDPAGVFW